MSSYDWRRAREAREAAAAASDHRERQAQLMIADMFEKRARANGFTICPGERG